jgi:hypothetical protein
METTSTLLAKLKEQEQEYATLENKMNNMALLFSESPKADANTMVAVDSDVLDKCFKLSETIETAFRTLIQFVGDTDIIPEVERMMLLQRGKNLSNNLKGTIDRREALLAAMCEAGLPSEVAKLGQALSEKLTCEAYPVFDTVSKQIRANLRRDNCVCYAYYHTFENVKAEVLIPVVSVIIFQAVDTSTGCAKGSPQVTITTNADNAPNRLQGIEIVDSEVMYALVKKMLDDSGLPLLKPISTKMAINENMLKRKWENVTTYANIIRVQLNMLLWPQYFLNTDDTFQPTEKLEADLFNDIKKATGYDDASIKYRMEITYPTCTIFFTLGVTSC